MASTIKLKNGSGAPLASDLVQGEPALDLTNKRLYTEDSLGAVIEVGTNPTELAVDTDTLYVDATNDRVGVNQPSPSEALDVIGDVILSTTGSNDVGVLHFGDTPDETKIIGRGPLHATAPDTIDFVTNTATAMTIDSSGNVGIGTTSPEDNGADYGDLTIGGSTGGYVSFTDGGVLRGEVGTGGTTMYVNAHSSVGNLVFGTNSGTERMRIDSSGNVGINTTSPDGKLHVSSGSAGGGSVSTAADDLVIENNGNTGVTFWSPNTASQNIYFADPQSQAAGLIQYNHPSDFMRFYTGGSEAMRINSDGDLLIGQTTDSSSDTGHILGNNGIAFHIRDAGICNVLNRLTNDGAIQVFRKDGATVGQINSYAGDMVIGTGDTGLWFRDGSDDIIPFNTSTNVNRDNAIDLGDGTAGRFDDIFATNGTIQTSDRNEKQDIEELSEAEQRVAVAAKALMRKFRWKSAVEEKGDDARIHFGIIAQDLQAAFEAEGLDAGRYAMFTSNTWWETQTEVEAVEAQDAVYETVTIPAVTEERLVSEAVYDDEGNEVEAAVYETVVIEEERTEERLVSEAVEAQEAYTRTDIYETAEEAPEGAVERTRLGVRYSELLAFIIAAI